MKTRLFLVAVFVVKAAWPESAPAENLFRIGRPDYARVPQSSVRTTSENWRRPVVADRYTDSATRTHRSYVARPTDDRSLLDYERVRAAWDHYRREAMRYQQRYGNANFVRDDLATRQVPDQPESRSICHCGGDRREVVGAIPNDFAPRNPIPTLPKIPPYGRAEFDRLPPRPGSPLPSTFDSYDRSRYPDPAKTASRAATNSLWSLLPEY